jgi:hypothetical protein
MPAQPPTAVPAGSTQMMLVTCPKGLRSGQPIMIQGKNGQQFQVPSLP